jgi:hypothetical protein
MPEPAMACDRPGFMSVPALAAAWQLAMDVSPRPLLAECLVSQLFKLRIENRLVIVQKMRRVRVGRSDYLSGAALHDAHTIWVDQR